MATSQKRLRYEDFVDRIDVSELENALGFEVILEDNKGNHVGHCFDLYGLHKHGDTTGKFAIHPEKKVYNCFVCGGGSLLSLVMEIKGWDDDEATDWPYQFAGVDNRTDDEFIQSFRARFYNEKPLKAVMPYFNPHVLDRFDEETDWFAERGISDTVRDVYKLGYSAKYTRPAPKKEKYVGEDEYVGPSIVLPHFFRGKLVGWQNRWLDNKRPKWVPKYTNTYDFPREETIFNYDLAKVSPGPVIVVESAPTVLYLESLGFPAVATFGAQVTDTQGKLLRAFQGGLILAADYDDAGYEWTEGIHLRLDDYVPIKEIDYSLVVDLHPAKDAGFDLGDFASEEDGKDMIQEMLDSAKKVSWDSY